LIALRVALPSIVRWQIEKQTSAALTGRLTVGDVDLWLLLGGVALKDVAFRPDDAAPDAPPLLALQRIYVQVGYFPFFRHTVRVKDFELEGPAVHLARLKSGAVPLPGPRPAPPSTSPTTTLPAVPEGEAGTPTGAEKIAEVAKRWNILVDQAALHQGRFEVLDHVSDPPEMTALGLEQLGLKNFTLYRAGEGEPGRGTIEMQFGDGRVRLKTAIATRENGYAIQAVVDAENLPLDRLQTHVPQLGWSTFKGRLDSHLTFRVEPRELPSTTGTLAIRDLQVDVPGENEPALAWKKLAVDLDEIALVRRRAVVKTVGIDGLRVIVTPKSPAPLPLLTGILHPHAKETTAGAPDAAPPEPAAPPASASPAAAEPAPPWTWKVGTVDITDAKATVVLEPPPLAVEIVKGTVTGLESAPGSRAQVDLQLRQDRGTIGLAGSVVLSPLAATLHTKIDGLALGTLLAASGATPIQLPTGTLGADLDVKAEQGPLVVAGKLSIADLAVKTPQGQDFGAGWKRLELDVREIRVPGVFPGTKPITPEPIRVDLDRLQLVAPVASLTRTPEGLVLPTGGTPAPPPETSAPARRSRGRAPAAKPSAPPAAAPPAANAPVALSLARLDIQDGQVTVLDRAVKPFYRGKLSALTVKASGLRYPENAFDDFTLTATLPGGSPLKLTGKQSKGTIQLTADGKALPLSQFNPYMRQAAGYSISGGKLTVGSKVTWSPKGYDSKTRVEFDQLGVAGAEGDSLFLQKVGIPLTLALSLLRDINGRIALDIPVAGDQQGMRVGLGTIVAEAIVKAILGAVMSPLKMFGAVFDLAKGAAGAGAPEPIPCIAGQPTVTSEGKPRIDQVASGLGASPALRVTLRGSAGGPDVRGLQEAAVLAELKQSNKVFGGVANLASGGSRNAIRAALEARVTGAPGELSSDDQKKLDQWTAEKTVSDDQLRALAAARAEAVKNTLVHDQGVDASRVGVGDPDVDRDHGTPGVKIGLGG
jgi:hypothetical protein